MGNVDWQMSAKAGGRGRDCESQELPSVVGRWAEVGEDVKENKSDLAKGDVQLPENFERPTVVLPAEETNRIKRGHYFVVDEYHMTCAARYIDSATTRNET